MTSTGWAAPSYDVLVIGAGLAGLTAGRAAGRGRREGHARLAKGVGATHLGPGTIDVLGYAPDRVERPGEALAGLGGDHPYARLGGADASRGASTGSSASSTAARSPRTLPGSLDENVVLPTTVGAPKPSALVPETMAAGDLRADAADARRRLLRAARLPRRATSPTTSPRGGVAGARRS